MAKQETKSGFIGFNRLSLESLSAEHTAGIAGDDHESLASAIIVWV
jgi:hypothetical protein